MKTKMDLQTKILEYLKSLKLQCNTQDNMENFWNNFQFPDDIYPISYDQRDQIIQRIKLSNIMYFSLKINFNKILVSSIKYNKITQLLTRLKSRNNKSFLVGILNSSMNLLFLWFFQFAEEVLFLRFISFNLWFHSCENIVS